MSSHRYVHGYSDNEAIRLDDQARVLEEYLHRDTIYPQGVKVLEAGCGVGAQTRLLAFRNRQAYFTSIDLSEKSLEQARQACDAANLTNILFEQADVYSLPYEDNSFDHVFCCFVLEHLDRPPRALRELVRVLRPAGSLTVIEGDHGSFFCHPESPPARAAVHCLIELQQSKGGNALIGRELYSLLSGAGLDDVRVSPRTIYADHSRPDLVSGFARKTFIAMTEAIGEEAVERGLVSKSQWQAGIDGLNRATEPDGSFIYTFFKAIGRKP